MNKVDTVLSIILILTILIVGIAGLLGLDANTMMSIIKFGIISSSTVIVGFIITYVKEV